MIKTYHHIHFNPLLSIIRTTMKIKTVQPLLRIRRNTHHKLKNPNIKIKKPHHTKPPTCSEILASRPVWWIVIGNMLSVQVFVGSLLTSRAILDNGTLDSWNSFGRPSVITAFFAGPLQSIFKLHPNHYFHRQLKPNSQSGFQIHGKENWINACVLPYRIP